MSWASVYPKAPLCASSPRAGHRDPRFFLCPCPWAPLSNQVSQFSPPFSSLAKLPPVSDSAQGRSIMSSYHLPISAQIWHFLVFPWPTGETQENNLPARSSGTFNHFFCLPRHLWMTPNNLAVVPGVSVHIPRVLSAKSHDNPKSLHGQGDNKNSYFLPIWTKPMGCLKQQQRLFFFSSILGTWCSSASPQLKEAELVCSPGAGLSSCWYFGMLKALCIMVVLWAA